MRYRLAFTGIVLAVCSLAAAQESTGDRLVVPARNSARPRKIDIQASQGAVVIKAYNGKDVIVEARSSRGTEPRRTVNGMRRIDMPPRGLTVEEEDNVITIRTSGSASSEEVVISAPPETSVTARTHNGGVEIQGLRGEFDVESHNGEVNLINVSGSVLAHSLNGAIRVSMDRVDPAKPLSFSTLNGSIDVTFPADWKANVKLSTNQGEIWSDFDFRLGGTVSTQQTNSKEGKFRVAMDSALTGTVNGGGPEAMFKSFNGRITIKKK